MGPPSRYNLYATAHAHTLQAQDSVPLRDGADTSSRSNTELAKHHIRLLATATTPEEFSARANDAFSRSINITVNGIHLSRDLYAQQWGASFHAAGTVGFGNAIETPNVRIPMFQNAALVGVMYDASFTTSADGRNAFGRYPLQLAVSVTSTINLIIADDKTLPDSSSDRRRIVSINQVIVDKDGLLTFPIRNP